MISPEQAHPNDGRLRQSAEEETRLQLSPEESLLWACARHWPEPQSAVDLAQAGIDWDVAVKVAVDNRMQILLRQALAKRQMIASLPEDAATLLQRACARTEQAADMLTVALGQYLSFAARRNQEVVVLKGLWLSERIYGDKNMRPGGDIDILIREEAIPQSMAILEDDMGYGTWWRPLLDDRYYQRHHLHQQRCNDDRSIWIEPHWRLDHPYNQLTIDYGAMMDRAQPGELWGLPIRELSPPDLLLALAIHLVKHAVYLPAVLTRPDLPRLILADGMLMYFADVAAAIKVYQDRIDWRQVIALARQGGAVDSLGPVLRVCHDYLGSDIPAFVLEQLTAAKPRGLNRLALERMAEYELAIYQGQKPGRLWSLLLGYQESIVFRPIRLLDFVSYLFPGDDYLRRRYDRATVVNRLRHLLLTAGRYLRIAGDTVYYTIKRRLQVMALDRQGFEWPPPPGMDG